MSLKEPSFYSNSLSKLYLMFNTSLDEIENSFIKFKVGQNSNYENDMKVLNDVKAEIFVTQEQLFSETEKLKHEIDTLNFLITELNESNTKLINKINKLDNSGLAAEGELKIQKTLYMELFTQNIVLILGIIIMFFSLIKKK